MSPSLWSDHFVIQIQIENDSLKLTMGLVHIPFSIHVYMGLNGALHISDLRSFFEALVIQSLDFDVLGSKYPRFRGSCPITIFLRISVMLRYLRFQMSI